MVRRRSQTPSALAVAIVVVIPAPVSIAENFATNTDIAVSLNFTEALCILDLDGIGAAALRNLSSRSLLALGKHLRCLVTRYRILLEHVVGHLIDGYLIVCSGRRSQNRHYFLSFDQVQRNSALLGLLVGLITSLKASSSWPSCFRASQCPETVAWNFCQARFPFFNSYQV